MSEEVTTESVVDAAPAVEPVDDGERENRIPESRVKQMIAKEREAASAAKKEAAELNKRIQAIEDKDKSEAERLQSEIDRLQAEHAKADAAREVAEARIVRSERSALVRSAAEKAGVIDADVAVAMLDLDSVEDAAAAKAAVAQFVKDRPHLVKHAEADTPKLEKVTGSTGADSDQPKPPTDAERLTRLYDSSGKGFFSDAMIKDQGGGVIPPVGAEG